MTEYSKSICFEDVDDFLRTRIIANNLDGEDLAFEIIGLMENVLSLLSRHFDLKSLDSIVISGSYSEYLGQIDRGFEASSKLTPTAGDNRGIAMTPRVIRKGELKSIVVLDVFIFYMLAQKDSLELADVLNIIAHEFAHVEVSSKFNNAFPEMVLNKKLGGVQYYRWNCILSCWDEFAATYKSATIGKSPIVKHEEIFLCALGKTKSQIIDSVTRYRLHGDVDTVLGEVFEINTLLMKYASYYLGDLMGLGVTIGERIEGKAVLSGSWFEKYFHRLKECLEVIMNGYGCWENKDGFESLGCIIDDLVEESGLYITVLDEKNSYVDIPQTPETTPKFSAFVSYVPSFIKAVLVEKNIRNFCFSIGLSFTYYRHPAPLAR